MENKTKRTSVKNKDAMYFLNKLIEIALKVMLFMIVSIVMWSFVAVNTYEVLQDINMFGLYNASEVLTSGLAVTIICAVWSVDVMFFKWLIK